MNEHEDGGRQFCSIQQPPKNTNSVTSQFHAIDLNLNNSEASNLVTANLSNSQSMPYEDNSGGLIDANPDLPLDQENDANDDEDESKIEKYFIRFLNIEEIFRNRNRSIVWL